MIKTASISFHQPSYVMNANGQPEAVLIDIATWRMILERLQDMADNQILSQTMADLKTLANGERPAGWKNWDEFETKLAR